jgi:hypothetical protein
VHLYFTKNRQWRQKRRSLRLPQTLFSPLKTSGLRSAQPKKKRRNAPLILALVHFWWNFTTLLEPTFKKNADKCKLSPNTSRVYRAPMYRQTQKPFSYFLEITPAVFFGS